MLYQFEIALSDVDRGIYETLSFRANQHPSETGLYLLTRALAYVLSYQENLEFSPGGLADPDVPALQAKGPTGELELWIEIGNPSAKKLHRAGKAAAQVRVYTYKNPDLLTKEIAANTVYRAKDIQIYAFDPKFLQSLELELKKNCRWTILNQEGHLDIDTGVKIFATDVRKV